MGFWDKLFSEDAVEESLRTVEIPLKELKKQVKNSLLRVNKLENDGLTEPVMNELDNIKSILNALMSRELKNDYNQALIISANTARKKIRDELEPLINLRKPTTLVGVNQLVIDIEELLTKANKVINQSTNAQVLFREEINNLSNALDNLSMLIPELKDSVADRNDQLSDFKSLVDEIKAYDESINNLQEIKDEEFDVRKKISARERDKTYFSSEINRLKTLEKYADLRMMQSGLDNIHKRKNKLESLASKQVSKFSKLLRKVFNNDEFTIKLLTNPLKCIINNEGEFNKRMNKLINDLSNNKLKVSDKSKNKYLKALSDDKLDDYIDSYKKLLAEDKKLSKNDFSLVNRAHAFERRLIKMNQEVNKAVKSLDNFKERKSEQKMRIEALKAKVEAVASQCYDENVRLIN